MITNRLSDLMYQVPEEAPVNPFAMPQGLMMLAQAKPQPNIYWQKRLQMNDFETPDEELFKRANQPQQQAPIQGGGYKTGSDFVYKPKTNAEIEAFRRKAMEEAIRNRQR